VNTVWVVILVTAVSPFSYNVAPLTDADTLEECHRRATHIEHDIKRGDNQGRKCIRVD